MKDDDKILKLVYTFFLGLLLAIFIGVGISTFYTAPEPPEYPAELTEVYKEFDEEQLSRQTEYDESLRTFEEEQMAPYNRNVSIITLTAAILLMVLSMVLENKKMKVIADGVMLGGLFTLFYSLGRGFASQDSRYNFLTVSVGLAVVLYLGYRRFVQNHDTQTDKTPS